MSHRPILVTGGAGYIGSHTMVALSEAGYQPIIVDDFRNANRNVLKGLHNLLDMEPTCYEVDVTDEKALQQVFTQVQPVGVIHFAANKAVGESVADPLMYYHNNLMGLIAVAKQCLQHNVHHLVFSSSCTVYGEPKGNHAVDESTPIGEPASPYGRTKIIGEQILRDVHHAHPQLGILNLRYFNPVGAHPSGEIGEFPIGKPNNLLPFITQTAAGKWSELTVFGGDYNTPDGTCVRDYIHVCDLAEAHVKALQLLEREGPLYDAINIGTGQGTSVLDMITAFEELTGHELNWKMGDRRPGDVPMIYAKVEKAHEKLHWHTKRTVEDALADAWNWEQKLMEHEK
jgi:UDP-glucose 4-epimerase